jgi:hypothetical protein
MNKIDDVRKLEAAFSQVTSVCDGSDILNQWQEKIVRVFGIIATHIESSFTTENPLVLSGLDYGGQEFSVVFCNCNGNNNGFVVYRQDGRDCKVEVNHCANRGRNTLPISLIMPVVRALPEILECALRRSRSLFAFYQVCMEALELQEASERVDIEKCLKIGE